MPAPLRRSSLPHDTGLNLEDPGIHNGLSGTMVVKGDHFQVNGIPVVPVDDAADLDPYQIADITVRDSGTNAVLVQTSATVPTSDEFNCAKCHAAGGAGNAHIPAAGADVFANVLGSTTTGSPARPWRLQPPVLCASCHGSPGPGTERSGLLGLIPVPGHPRLARRQGRGLLRLPSRRDGQVQPERRPHGRGRQLHHLSRHDAGRGQLDRDRRPDPLGERAHVRDLPRRRGRGQHRERRSTGTPAVITASPARPATAARTPWSRASRPRTTPKRSSTRRPSPRSGTARSATTPPRAAASSEFTEAHGGSRATACSVCHTAAPRARRFRVASPVPVEEPLRGEPLGRPEETP